jgi:hypothetical protein
VANNKFQIDITAKDRTAEAVKSAQEHFEKLTKGTKVGEHLEGFGKIVEKGKHLAGIGKSLLSMGDNAAESAGGIGEAASGMEMLAAGAGVAALGVAGVGTALVATVGAAYKFEEGFTKAGAATGYLAQIMGMSATELQKFQIAGEEVGVSNEAMAQSLQNLGNTLNDARFGRNQGALALLTRLGIQIPTLKDGSIDAGRAMMLLADAMQGANAQTKQMIVAQFGVAGAESFMLESTKARQAALEEAARSGAVMTDKQIADSQRFQKSVHQLDDEWHGLLNAFSQKLVIPWLQPTIDGVINLTDSLKHLISGESDKHPGRRSSSGAAAPAGGSSAVAPAGNSASIQSYFVKQGWTPAQAAGIAANLQAESNFNPRAIGDNGRAVGIGQWHADRQAAFANWAGHDIGMSSMAEQLAFVQHELTQGGRKGAGDRLRQASDAQSAGAVVSRYYEGPADVGGEMAKRGALADKIFAANGGKPPAVGAAPEALASNDQGATVPSATVTTVNGSVHVDISMRGAPPGTIATAQAKGQGVTATARIAPTMSGSA